MTSEIFRNPEFIETSLESATILEPHGMCGGVVAAVNFTERLLNLVAGSEEVFTFNPIVHNHRINERFQENGLVVITERTSNGDWPLELIPDNSLVLHSAHGHKDSDVHVLEEKGCLVVTTVCTLVKNEWNEVSKAANQGKMVLLFGKEGHPEPRGTLSRAPNDSIIQISSPEDLERYVKSDDFDPEREHIMANQTTLSVRDIREMRDKAIDLIPNIDINDKRGGCYATDNRQRAAEVALEEQGADALLVVGSGDISNNTKNLCKVAIDLGKPGWIVNGASEINWDWLGINSGIEHLAVTSSASCDEEDLEGVIDALRGNYIEIYYQEPVVRERSTEFPIPANAKWPEIEARFAAKL